MKSAKKSGIIIAKENGKFYIDAETIHSLIIGTTRSGKGQTFVMPMIRHIAMSQAKHSMVINDPKGEIAENCTAMLRENGYKVVFLNLRDTNMSSLWNPLQKAIDEYKKARDNNEDLDKTIDEVQSLATVFTADEQSQPIWPESAKSLLVAMILYLLEKAMMTATLPMFLCIQYTICSLSSERKTRCKWSMVQSRVLMHWTAFSSHCPVGLLPRLHMQLPDFQRVTAEQVFSQRCHQTYQYLVQTAAYLA